MSKDDPEISLDRLKEFVSYDADTGIFTRRNSPRRRKAWRLMGSAMPSGYIRIRVTGHNVYAHRLAWFYVHGVWPQHDIDHINQNKSDNRISNLRDVNRSENLRNRPVWGAVKLKGVRVRGNRFEAQISINGRPKYLGSYKTAEAAHDAYLNACRDRQ